MHAGIAFPSVAKVYRKTGTRVRVDLRSVSELKHLSCTTQNIVKYHYQIQTKACHLLSKPAIA